MKKELRIMKLKEIKEQGSPYMTGIRIRYQGESRPFNAYKIPLEYLIYNKYNGRIGSLVKSFEKQNHILFAENQVDAQIIERFLWDSKPDRNEITMRSLVKDGQKQYGIVTNDGIIIDGNRRAMLLNKIYRARLEWEKDDHNVDECKYFIAAILPEGADPREVIKLETVYQMGEDEKLDYNPIEKYLRCKDLKHIHKYEVSDIAEMMGEKKSQIEEWLQIMRLMDDYLNYLNYDGIYTRLDKREGQFVDLNRYLERYKDNGSAIPDWGYGDLDLSDLKSVCFDYIRGQYEGKEFRYIAQPSKRESIFCREKVWQEFLENHKNDIETIAEPSIEKIREDNPDGDLTKLLEARDGYWKKLVEDKMKRHLGIARSRLEDINQADEPMALLKKALDSLNSLNTDIDTFYDTAVDDILREISRIAYEYRKLIKNRK
jgi:hypothetical protein